jgi:hypothetical protein
LCYLKLDEAFEIYQECSESEDAVKVMTFNLRGEDLDLDSKDNNWWRSRNTRAAAILAKYDPHFIGAQEGSVRQIRDLIAQYEKIPGSRAEFKHLGHTDQSVSTLPMFPVSQTSDTVF